MNTIELIENIRRREKIPEDYKSYQLPTGCWKDIISKYKAKGYEYFKITEGRKQQDVEDDEEETKNEELFIQYGRVDLKNAIIVREEQVDGTTYGDTVVRVILFTKEPEKIRDELYPKGEERSVKQIKRGVYKIIKGFFGIDLERIEIGEAKMPILNGKLDEKIKDEITRFIEKREMYKEMNLEHKRGILLIGKPGNGKTSLIRYITKNLDAVTLMSGTAWEEICMLEEVLKWDELKKTLKVIVMEDIDGMSYSERSKLLNLLDGMHKLENTIIIATTNYPEKLDIGIKDRPSRFDSIYNIRQPGLEERKKLIKMFFKDIKEEELEEAGKDTDGLSGAYFKEIYIMSRLNEWPIKETIKEIKRRMKDLNDDGVNYIG